MKRRALITGLWRVFLSIFCIAGTLVCQVGCNCVRLSNGIYVLTQEGVVDSLTINSDGTFRQSSSMIEGKIRKNKGGWMLHGTELILYGFRFLPTQTIEPTGEVTVIATIKNERNKPIIVISEMRNIRYRFID